METVRRAGATYQDVLDAPENCVAELIAGELHLQPRPAKPHTRAATTLAVELGAKFDRGLGGPGGWWILVEPELHLGRDVLVPDLAGWRRADTPAFDATVPYYEERPTWVCEILSPSTARKDRVLKLDAYHRAEVGWAWLVDPLAQTIEVFQWSDRGWLRLQTSEGGAPVTLSPFDGAALELEAVWPPSVGGAA
jgi:Uma2 family endonuclease